MAVVEPTKVETDTPAVLTPTTSQAEASDTPKKPGEPQALAVVEEGTAKPNPPRTSNDRDVALAQLEKEKKFSFIKAWEESEKTKAENKAQRELSAITAWENSKKAALEAKLRKMEEVLEKKKSEYGEQKKNKVAIIHKQAEEKRALVEAKRGEEILKAEEMSARFRATGQIPKKLMGCFGN